MRHCDDEFTVRSGFDLRNSPAQLLFGFSEVEKNPLRFMSAIIASGRRYHDGTVHTQFVAATAWGRIHFHAFFMPGVGHLLGDVPP